MSRKGKPTGHNLANVQIRLENLAQGSVWRGGQQVPVVGILAANLRFQRRFGYCVLVVR